MSNLYKPKEIFIEESVRDNENTLRICAAFPDVPVLYVENYADNKGIQSYKNDPVTEGKKRLFIAKNRAPFLKLCPGTKEYICCNYHVISLYTNCYLECSYCILQNYINSGFITVYVNTQDMFNEVENVLTENPDRLYRMGTGELSDSMALDYVTGYSKMLVSFFARQKNAVLELKTKTDFIDNLLDCEHNGRTIVSWSLNPENIVGSDELKTATLDERLEAAVKCQEAGYLLGFHFDPLLVYPGWEEGYSKVIDLLYKNIDSKKIVWISLGSLRFPPDLGNIMKKRFPKSKLPTGEFIPGIDGKMRYLKTIRQSIYSKVVSLINNYDTDPFIYFCMESKEIWQRTLGWAPANDDELDMKFTSRVDRL